MNQRLRFHARGTALVTDPHAQERGTRRFIGRRWQEAFPGRYVWAPTEKPQEVDYHHDLAKAARDGDLWPADKATADALGVPFDPSFGGERTETIKAFKEKLQSPASPPTAPETPDAKAGKSGGKGD
jgi:hypothetical protein